MDDFDYDWYTFFPQISDDMYANFSTSLLAEHSSNSSANRPPPLDHCGWPVPAVTPSQRLSPPSIRYLDLCSYPFLLQLTTFGNILNLFVLRMDKPFGSKGVYLSALAATDLIYMWSAIISYVSNYDGEIHGFPRPPVRYVVDRLNGLTMFLQETCVIASAWLIVAFTMERFLAIRHPLKHLITSHGRHSLFVVFTVIAVSVMIAIVRLVDYYWYYAHFIGLDPRPAKRPIRPAMLMRWFGVYVWALAIIQMGTFLAILFLNVGLLRVIILQQRFRRDSLHAVVPNSNQDRPNGGVDRGAVAMLAACSVSYLVTQAPGFVGNVLYLLDKGCVKQLSASTRTVMAPILNVLLNVNFSANFLLYCAANPKFRKGVKVLLRLEDTTSARRKSQSTNIDSFLSKYQRPSVCSKLNVRM